ncbi:hypothetical protein FA95DRAFT_1500132 [Auriscalpium vulgare]|uniref:Uncharacterized protein n=1 Tax=Auriscalpium vulgare TaxID=40419 RepID=A0ACB8REU8_9AGAM|nr:hypothetical protein FA95DRAFT_1500132 [Auriscalpium vulgare]
MEMLQMLKFTIRQGRGLNFTEGFTVEEELAHMESSESHQAQVPEDYASYISSLRGS